MKKYALILISSIVLVGMVVSIIPIKLKEIMINTIQEQVNAKASINSLKLHYFPLGIEIHGLTIGDSQKEFNNKVEVREVTCFISFSQLIKKRIMIPELSIEGIKFDQERALSGWLKKERTDFPINSQAKEVHVKDAQTKEAQAPFDVSQWIDKSKLTVLSDAAHINQTLTQHNKEWEIVTNVSDESDQLIQLESELNSIKGQ